MVNKALTGTGIFPQRLFFHPQFNHDTFIKYKQPSNNFSLRTLAHDAPAVFFARFPKTILDANENVLISNGSLVAFATAAAALGFGAVSSRTEACDWTALGFGAVSSSTEACGWAATAAAAAVVEDIAAVAMIAAVEPPTTELAAGAGAATATEVEAAGAGAGAAAGAELAATGGETGFAMAAVDPGLEVAAAADVTGAAPAGLTAEETGTGPAAAGELTLAAGGAAPPAAGETLTITAVLNVAELIAAGEAIVNIVVP
jgi:hypothetical protein